MEDELATLLQEIWRTAKPGPSAALEVEARNHMPQRINTLGQGLFEALSEAVAVRRSGHGR